MRKVVHPGPDSRVKGEPKSHASLRIGEVAARAGVRIDTVRFYEREGLLRAVSRSRSGYRQFPPDAVERIGFIRQAQAIGFRLDEVREVLGALDSGEVSYERGLVRLRAVAERVDAKIAELRAVRKQLSAMIERFEAGHCTAMEAAARAIRGR
ncbi:MerR-family transcriptional regulator [Minicystis rosea]|nr:MerR-family transcriptional regulator [Minicystis rosea]